jgi:predicted nucleic acid-binding protein
VQEKVIFDTNIYRGYSDVCIALLARQIGATVVTRDVDDFRKINKVIDFRFRDVI